MGLEFEFLKFRGLLPPKPPKKGRGYAFYMQQQTLNISRTVNLYVAMGGIFLPPEHLNEHNFFSWTDTATIFCDFVGILFVYKIVKVA